MFKVLLGFAIGSTSTGAVSIGGGGGGGELGGLGGSEGSGGPALPSPKSLFGLLSLPSLVSSLEEDDECDSVDLLFLESEVDPLTVLIGGEFIKLFTFVISLILSIEEDPNLSKIPGISKGYLSVGFPK